MTLTYQHILASVEDNIGIVTLNRPKVLNALCFDLMDELVRALEQFDHDPSVRVMILTGNERAFAAGADIKEMSDESTIGILIKDRFATWDRIKKIKKPIIAAVSGYVLGGGCEVAMNCDIIIASETAQFGQPEINIGIMPGAGGTQRLTQVLGKYKAMEMILTGRSMSAHEAHALGLVNKVVPVELFLDEAKSVAREIAKKSPIAIRMAKEAILKTFDMSLSEGLEYERKNFYMLFASEDQKEGMRAFLEKRRQVQRQIRSTRMTEDNILLIDKKSGVGTITLNRPDRLNALNDELTFALQDALMEFEKDAQVRAIVLTGAGRGFCSGQDLQNRAVDDVIGAKLSLGDSIRRRYNPIIVKLRRIEKPIVVAINGVAAGAGASLAFACDLRIAADTATFIQSFSKIGLVPDSGSTFILPRLIGLTRAFELMITADKLEAAEALKLGLVNKVVDQSEVVKEALALAEKLASGPTRAFGLTKRAVNRAVFPDLEELLEYEASMQEIAGRTSDFVEGVKAFGEKRTPAYTGR